MCPDGELLSAWYDREVPEPWRSQIDEHIKDCATCSQIVAQMTSVHSHLENDELMMQLSGEMADIDQRVIRSVSVRGRSYRPVWTRSVLVPMPAVAGLVIVFVAGMFGMGTLLSRGSNPANAYSASVTIFGWPYRDTIGSSGNCMVMGVCPAPESI